MQPDQVPGPFLPGELVNPRRHATMDGLELRGLCDAQRAELDQLAHQTELSPTGVAIMALLGSLPRPKGRPLGVGLQLSTASLAAVLGRSVRMVHYALRELEDRQLVTRFTQTRSVKHITRHRLVPIDRITYRTKEGLQTRRKAHLTAVLYPTLTGLSLLERAGWTRTRVPGQGVRTVRIGLIGYLWTTLSQWIRALTLRCASAVEHCTPYEAVPRRERLDQIPAGAGAPGEVRPLGAIGQVGTATPPRGEDSVTDGRAGSGGRGGGFAAEVERCWLHYERVGRYVARRPDQLGFGYEARLVDRDADFWAPIVTAARWRPDFWRHADAAGRAWLESKFAPIRAELEARIARGETPWS